MRLPHSPIKLNFVRRKTEREQHGRRKRTYAEQQGLESTEVRKHVCQSMPSVLSHCEALLTNEGVSLYQNNERKSNATVISRKVNEVKFGKALNRWISERSQQRLSCGKEELTRESKVKTKQTRKVSVVRQQFPNKVSVNWST